MNDGREGCYAKYPVLCPEGGLCHHDMNHHRISLQSLEVIAVDCSDVDAEAVLVMTARDTAAIIRCDNMRMSIL